LPEAVLRGDVTLRKEQIVEVGGAECRNALCITGDSDWCSKSSKVKIAVELRKRGVHCAAKRDGYGDECNEDKQNKKEGYDKKSLRPAAAWRWESEDGIGVWGFWCAHALVRF
jgi:hypothetical protein